MWDPGIKLRSSGLVAGAFLFQSQHFYRAFYHGVSFNTLGDGYYHLHSMGVIQQFLELIIKTSQNLFYLM